MKLALTCQGETLDSALDIRFGRAENFIIYDDETKDFSVVPNTQNLNAVQGAGIQAAVTAASTGVEAVITGHCGPKAFRVLEEAGIRVYTSTASTVRGALSAFEEGKLTALSTADVNGHWV